LIAYDPPNGGFENELERVMGKVAVSLFQILGKLATEARQIAVSSRRELKVLW
jgi:hypothetical protein